MITFVLLFYFYFCVFLKFNDDYLVVSCLFEYIIAFIHLIHLTSKSKDHGENFCMLSKVVKYCAPLFRYIYIS